MSALKRKVCAVEGARHGARRVFWFGTHDLDRPTQSELERLAAEVGETIRPDDLATVIYHPRLQGDNEPSGLPARFYGAFPR